MKKVVSLVGVGAMVLMLGLGSGFAQQAAPKEAPAVPAVTQGKQVTPTDVAKDKALPAKPGVEVKAEQGAPVAPPTGKASDAAGSVKAVTDTKAEKPATAGKEAEKAVTPKPTLEAKPDATAPVKSSVGQATDKTVAAKPALDAKSEKAAVPIPTTEKAPVKADDVKTPVKQ